MFEPKYILATDHDFIEYDSGPKISVTCEFPDNVLDALKSTQQHGDYYNLIMNCDWTQTQNLMSKV